MAMGKRTGPLTASDLRDIEDAVVKAGKNGISKILDKHFVEIEKIQDKYVLPNGELISSRLVLNEGLTKALREKIEQLGSNVQSAIEETANQFEVRAFASVEDALEKLKLSKYQLGRVERMTSAQREMLHSHTSMRFAIQVFVQVNKDMLTSLEDARRKNDGSLETDLLLKNAILVYELANTAARILEGFEITGRDAFQAIKKEVFAELEANRLQDLNLERQCAAPGVAVGIRDQTREAIRMRNQNREQVRVAWTEMDKKMAEFESKAQSLKQHVNTLKVIRENARSQLAFLGLMTVTQMMKQNLDAVQGLLDIKDLELAMLRPEDVCRLLNIQTAGALPA